MGAGVSRRARWWGAVACFVVLPLAVLGIAVARLDPNDYKPAIIEAVQDATGRTLSLNGPLRLSRSLWPTIEASDVALSNLPGGTRPDMARAERIEASLSLPALLRRRIEVTKLALVGPNILFEQVDGKSNWVFDPPGRSASVPVATPGTPFQLRVRNARVQNSMVTWRLPARTKVVGIRSLNVRHHTDDGPLETDAVLVYADNQPFSIKASATPEAGFTGPWTTQLDFAAFDTTASAMGTMDLAGHYDLQVDAQAGALEKLNALLPEMRLPPLHQAALSTHLTNGKRPGDLPVIGATRLHFADADLSGRVRGLRLGAVDVSLPAAGALATVAGGGQFAGEPFTLAGSVAVPVHPDERVNLPIDMTVEATPTGGEPASSSIALKGKLGLDALAFDGLDATVALRTPALAPLRPVLTQKLPALTGGELRWAAGGSGQCRVGEVHRRKAANEGGRYRRRRQDRARNGSHAGCQAALWQARRRCDAGSVRGWTGAASSTGRYGRADDPRHATALANTARTRDQCHRQRRRHDVPRPGLEGC